MTWKAVIEQSTIPFKCLTGIRNNLKVSQILFLGFRLFSVLMLRLEISDLMCTIWIPCRGRLPKRSAAEIWVCFTT